jgi:3-methyladenine DNA glycosylase AlkD
MKKSEVFAWMKENQDERGIAHWKKSENTPAGMKSYGIGLVTLRKFAKSVGRDAKLAGQLWKSDVHEMRIISLLVDDPKAMKMDQAETQVEQLDGGYLAHVFSSCDATLAKTPFVVEIADKWVESNDTIRRRCGYGLLYEISKSKKKTAPDEDYFLEHISDIEKKHPTAPVPVLMPMAGALTGIGKRTRKLNRAALKVARQIGPIDFDPDGSCDPFDAVKHLTGEYVKKKLGL